MSEASISWDDVWFSVCEARYVKLIVKSTNGNGNPTLAEFRVTSSYEYGNPKGTKLRNTVIDFKGSDLGKSHATVDEQGNITEAIEYTDGNKTSIRFGYKMYTVIDGYELTSWKWNWSTDETNLNKEVTGKNMLPDKDEEDAYTSNLVIQNVPVANYETPIYSKLILTYTSETTGETLTIDTGIQERSVYQVADSSKTNAEDGEYAQKILNAYAAYQN